MIYTVTVTRTSLYKVHAGDEDAAIDKALSGEIEESPGGETTGATAELEAAAVLDLDKVCTLVHAHGVAAYVEQTGGGCATIYAGELSNADDPETAPRWDAVAGPGWFEGPEWTIPRASVAEFCVGPDDDGTADPVWSNVGWDERRAAGEILAQVEATQRIRALAVQR